MNESAPPGDRRAQTAALSGLFIQLMLFGLAIFVGLWDETKSDALVTVARHALGGVLIWIILLLVFTQRRKSRLEELETQQLQRQQAAGAATNLFDVADESLLLERRRLAWTYKFLLPIVTILLIVYHVGTSAAWFNWSLQYPLTDENWNRSLRPLVAMVFMAGIAFVGFVFSRYIVGMARQPNWRLLRAGGSYLIGNAMTATILVVTLAWSSSRSMDNWVEPLAAYIVNCIMLILGIEFTINFILEFYRPRKTDEEIRPAFDSRLLALFSEPGGIVRSIADTINYQFGFEVSGTWFYKLLQRSVFPLAVLTLFSLILLSSIVVVDVDEEAYVERFGKIKQDVGEPLTPGIHFKAPWPIDRVVRARVNRMRYLTVGTKHEESWKKREGAEHVDDHIVTEHELEHAVLWTEEHHHVVAGMLVLVANPELDALSFDARDSDGEKAASRGGEGVSLLMISADVEYYIDDLNRYKYYYQDPEEILETVATQQLSDYAASHDAEFLMGRGRETFSQTMRQRIQDRCDELDIGIRITMVGLHAHPPTSDNVAKGYQDVIAAELRKAATIEHANGLHHRILTLTTGNLERAKSLDDAIAEMDRLVSESEKLETEASRRAADAATKRVQDLLMGNEAKGIASASGRVAATIAQARADRAKAISEAESKSRTYENDLVAYQSSPNLFKMRRYLGILKETLPSLRKYVYTGNPENLIIEYETEQGGFLDLSTEQDPAMPALHDH